MTDTQESPEDNRKMRKEMVANQKAKNKRHPNNSIQKYNCEVCHDTGFYGDNGPGTIGNDEYVECDNCSMPDKIASAYPMDTFISRLDAEIEELETMINNPTISDMAYYQISDKILPHLKKCRDYFNRNFNTASSKTQITTNK